MVKKTQIGNDSPCFSQYNERDAGLPDQMAEAARGSTMLNYLANNYITLMLLLALAVFILVNRRKANIPAAKFFWLAIILVLLITTTEAADTWLSEVSADGLSTGEMEHLRRMRILASFTSYILLPLVIMIEVLITAPSRGFKILCIIPAVFNTVIYGTALTGSGLAFTINESNHWVRGPMGLTIYFVLMFYVFLLALFSIIYFHWDNGERSAIIFLIVIQSILSMVLEGLNIINRTSAPTTALCMLEYYIYLSVVYQHEMQQLIAEKELHIAQQRMDLLRSQIQPHFIFNSLAVIRSLTKHDSRKAVDCIDSFSDYLKAHIYAVQEEDMIPFQDELVHIRAYLDLVLADSTRNVEVVYDLHYTDFRLPALSLEPIVENSIKHGIGSRGGTITIQTEKSEKGAVIRIMDNGSPEGGMTEQENKRLGVGLENTRKRLKMQCSGTLDLQITDHGATATIVIPQEDPTDPDDAF